MQTSLTDLFDNQQQTVPQSLTPLQSTILSKSTASKSTTSPFSAQSDRSINTDSNGQAKSARGDDDDYCSTEVEATTRGRDPSSVSDTRATSLISKFHDRKLQSRESERVGQKRAADSSRPPREHRRLSSTSVNEEDDDSPTEDAQTTTDTAPTEKIFVGADQPVIDFNKRLSEFQPAVSNNPPPSPPSRANSEADIPSIVQSPAKPIVGVVPNAFDRMRPLRTPLQEATITIDDKVFTSVIGSQPTPQQSRFTVAAPRSKATPKRAPLVNHNFTQALSSFRAADSGGGTVTKLAIEPSDDDQEEIDDGEYPVEVEAVENRDNELDSSERYSNQEESVFKRPRKTTGEMQHLGSGINHRQPGRVASNTSIRDEQYDATGSKAALPALDVTDEEDDSDAEYLDEATKKATEDAKVARMIQEAEERAAHPTEDDSKRAQSILKGINRKHATFNLSQILDLSVENIDQQMQILEQALGTTSLPLARKEETLSQIEPNTTAEDRLSLTISKADFQRMRIIGQFNLGFIIAIRSSTSAPAIPILTQDFPTTSSDIFIIDQHASDEKSNFESLQETTTVQAQPLVNAFPLSLTAIEEEIIIENHEAFTKNGFVISIDESGDSPVGQRCKLLALPTSKELTFDLRDLEELIALLAESSNFVSYSQEDLGVVDEASESQILTKKSPARTVVRPTKVRKMFAMRACRSSIMIGKSLSHKDMRKVVRRMGEMDKPWNCPHGRPTMRHLVSLEKWQGWMEGDGLAGEGNDDEGIEDREVEEDIDWGAWMSR